MNETDIDACLSDLRERVEWIARRVFLLSVEAGVEYAARMEDFEAAKEKPCTDE